MSCHPYGPATQIIFSNTAYLRIPPLDSLDSLDPLEKTYLSQLSLIDVDRPVPSMTKSRILFTAPTVRWKRPSRMTVKKFYGQVTTSHGGRYRYRRRALLDEVPHISLGRGVIVVRRVDLDRVIRFLDYWGVGYTTRDVILSPEDRQRLANKLSQ